MAALPPSPPFSSSSSFSSLLLLPPSPPLPPPLSSFLLRPLPSLPDKRVSCGPAGRQEGTDAADQHRAWRPRHRAVLAAVAIYGEPEFICVDNTPHLTPLKSSSSPLFFLISCSSRRRCRLSASPLAAPPSTDPPRLSCGQTDSEDGTSVDSLVVTHVQSRFCCRIKIHRAERPYSSSVKDEAIIGNI